VGAVDLRRSPGMPKIGNCSNSALAMKQKSFFISYFGLAVRLHCQVAYGFEN
jgi:hypothetical protein